MAATTPVTGGRLPAAFDVIASELTTRASTETLDAAMVRDFVGRMVLQAMALADEGRAAAVTEATEIVLRRRRPPSVVSHSYLCSPRSQWSSGTTCSAACFRGLPCRAQPGRCP